MTQTPRARIAAICLAWLLASLTSSPAALAQSDDAPSEEPAPATGDDGQAPPPEDATPDAENEAAAAEDGEDAPPTEDEVSDPADDGDEPEAAPPEPGTSERSPAEGEAATPAEPSASSDDEAAPVGGPSAPAETSRSVAAQQAEAGRAFYRAGNYVGALGAFKAAFEIEPTAAIAYNVARSHERLSQWAEAIEWYQRYAEMETDPRERADALDKITLLRQRVGGEATVDQYEARMISGKRAYARGDFEGAVEEFQSAFDVRAEPGPLYNIAKSYEKMARYEDALDYFRQYLELAPNAPDKADVEAIMERLERDLRGRFQELAVASDPPGADVYLDDRNEGIIGQTNLRTKLRPGPHTLYIDLNGYEPVRRDFVMPDDKPLALEFDLKELENVGFVAIAVSQPGARIFVDGAIVGLSPFAQKKALEAGEHQLQVELVGYDRYTESFTVTREETTTLDIDLQKYDPPVAEETLSDWGRNLLLFGIVGGGLGFGGPIVYQELVLGRPYFSSLGPETGNGRPFYDRTPASLRKNEELDTLETVQLASLIAGGTLVVSGFVVYMYKWLRDTPPPPVTAAAGPSGAPLVEITGLGVAPTSDGAGASFGISGSF